MKTTPDNEETMQRYSNANKGTRKASRQSRSARIKVYHLQWGATSFRHLRQVAVGTIP